MRKSANDVRCEFLQTLFITYHILLNFAFTFSCYSGRQIRGGLLKELKDSAILLNKRYPAHFCSIHVQGTVIWDMMLPLQLRGCFCGEEAVFSSMGLSSCFIGTSSSITHLGGRIGLQPDGNTPPWGVASPIMGGSWARQRFQTECFLKLPNSGTTGNLTEQWLIFGSR